MTQPQYTLVIPFEQLAPFIDASGDCWEWTGLITPTGYGRVNVKINGRWLNRRAHRLVWTALCGPIADTLTIDHLCRARHCVNPDHLEPVTCRVNTLRGVGVTAKNARKAACLRGHSNWRVSPDRKGWRECVECRRAIDKRHSIARKAKSQPNERQHQH